MNKRVLILVVFLVLIGAIQSIGQNTDIIVKEATNLARMMGGGAPDKYLDDTELVIYPPVKINAQNRPVGFKVSGTIRNIELGESPFYGVQELTKKNKVLNGSINSFGVILHHGKSGCSKTKYAVKDLQKICDSWKNSGNIIDFNMTNKEHYVFVARLDGADIPNNYRFGHNGLTQEAIRGFNQAMSVNNPNIRSFCINDKGNWAIIGDGATIFDNDIIEDCFFVADAKTMAFINEARKLYGRVRTVSMTDMGIVICCELGVWLKDVPGPVYEALKTLNFKPYLVKFHDSGHYIIADGNGKCVTSL